VTGVEQSRDPKPAKRVRKASVASLLFCFISLFLEGVSLLRRNRFPVNFGGQKMQEVSIAAALLAGEIDFSQGYAHRFPVFFPVLPRKVGPKSPEFISGEPAAPGCGYERGTRRRGRGLRSQAIPPPDRDCSDRQIKTFKATAARSRRQSCTYYQTNPILVGPMRDRPY
jgi:hypothetical protein